MGLAKSMLLDAKAKAFAIDIAKEVLDGEAVKNRTDAELIQFGFGIMIARNLETLDQFLNTFYFAMEDANLHAYNEIIEIMKVSTGRQILRNFLPILKKLIEIDDTSGELIHLGFFEEWKKEVERADY